MKPRAVAAKVFLTLAFLLGCGSAWAGACTLASQAKGGLFDSTVSSFYGASSSWLTNASGIASHIFWALAAIEFTWAAINWVLRKHEIGDLLASVFFKIMSIMFFYWLAISYAPTWIPMVLQGFGQMATGVLGSTGTTPPTVEPGMISPSAVMNVGLCVANNLTVSASNWAASGLADKFLFALMTVASIVVTIIAYFLITLQLLMTEIEAFIVLFGGAVMLGFTGSRWTLPWGEKYFAYAVSVGVKLMVIFLIVGLGDQIVTNGVNALVTGQTLTLGQYAQMMMVVLIYAGLAWNVPSMAGSFLNGTPNMSLGSMAGAAMAATGAAVGAAAAIPGSAAAVSGAAKSAVSGAKSLGSTAADTAQTASSAYQSVAAAGQRMLGLGGGGSSGSSAPKPSPGGGNPGGTPNAPAGDQGTGEKDASAATDKGAPAAANKGTSASGKSASASPVEAAAQLPSEGSPVPDEFVPLEEIAASDRYNIPPSLGTGSFTGTDGKSTSGDAIPDQAIPDQKPPEVSPVGNDNAIAGAGAAQTGGMASAGQMDKLTAAIDKLAGSQQAPSFGQRAGAYAKDKLSSAAQHLKSSDGQTGSASIRFKHYED
ncbi:MAG: P-type conjugative transfer protein TrbL [Burkholderiaceae bacterium]|nr:P-type conjugative transfer protein TrbL [Burkholderiaceae bacterium]